MLVFQAEGGKMVTGIRVLLGEEAAVHSGFIDVLTQVLLKYNYLELVVPSIWKGELISNVCPLLQEMHIEWRLVHPRPIKLFYVARTFKSGREATKFGVAILGEVTETVEDMSIDLLMECFERYSDDFLF